MKKIITIITIFLIAANGIYAQNSLTALQVLDKAVATVTGSKGLEVKFTINNSGYNGGGSLKTSGNKFSVTLPDASVWYNGSVMYTYNKKTSETTLTVPTAGEIAETNPMAYITGAKNNYNVAYSTVKKAGKYVLELTPKKKGDIKRITLTLKSSGFVPEKIVVEPSAGNPIVAEITSFRTLATVNSSDFEYPKSKYPGIEIIDLR